MDQSSDDLVAPQATPRPLTTSSDPTQIDSSADKHVSDTGFFQEALNMVLNFLSTSNNETLLGVFALLTLMTYLILGRIGLVLIGVALGIILHASWEGTHEHGDEALSMPRKRRELALEVSKRLLDWPKFATAAETSTKMDAGLVANPEDMSASDLDFASFQPATAAALRSLTDAVVRDYVKYWYEPILPNESIFPGSCRRTLTHFVTALSSHLSRKRTEDTFLQFLTNSSSIIIVFLNELAAAFSAVGPSPIEAPGIVNQYLESAPDSSLASVLSEDQQRKKLNMIADDVLSNFLDPKAYGCLPVRDFLREIFAGVVLESTVISLSRPEFINDWIVYLLQDGESEIMHAIDAGVEGARNQATGDPKASDEAKKASLEEHKDRALSQAAEQQSIHSDKVTEEALLEARRLSALMTSPDMHTDSELPVRSSQSEEPRLSTERIHGPPAEPPQPKPTSDCLVQDQIPSNDSQMSLSPPASPDALGQRTPAPREDTSLSPLSLHGAQIMVDDDGATSERGPIKARPTWDYLLQIEPASSRSTGWMVFRKYSEFQSLHEMLETVSRLNRIHTFSEQFPTLPPWKGKTRQALARDLERYLQQAMKHESLANTDRMRRFLEKEGGPPEASPAKAGFSFPSQSAFENMGKGVLGALTNAPKGMAGGGRAVFDGVTGVFGGAGHNRKSTDTIAQQSQHQKNLSYSENEPQPGSFHGSNPPDASFKSKDLSHSPRNSGDGSSAALASSPTASMNLSNNEVPRTPLHTDHSSEINLAVNEQDAWASESTLTASEDRNSLEMSGLVDDTNGKEKKHGPASLKLQQENGLPADSGPDPRGERRRRQPITADETQIAVELIFAVINELYTLSSAWNIRRTLLNAARSYILRPGSPTLETIRELLQDSMIDTHTSDEALGEYLRKLRENALPTEAELKAWPPPPSEQEKAELRDKARRLFVQRGIPQALTSVMGAAASREALEKIFDSLQVESVARGFVFSVLLQGLRVLTL